MDITITSGMVFTIVCVVGMVISVLSTWFACSKVRDEGDVGWIVAGIMSAVGFIAALVGVCNSGVKIFETLEW